MSDSQNRNLKQDELHRLSRSRIFSHLSVTVLGGLFVFAVMQFAMDGLKGILVDGLFRMPSPARKNNDIIIIAYDDLASERYGFGARFPVDEMEAVFRAISPVEPLAVGVIGAFNERIYTSHELNRLNAIFKSIPTAVVGFNDDESLGRTRPAAFSDVAFYVPGFVSRDTFSYGGDSVSRRVMLTVDGQSTLFWTLTQIHCQKTSAGCTPSDFSIEHVGNSSQTYINWQKKRYPIFSSKQIAKGDFDPQVFRHKMVLIGTQLTARRGADHIFTPFSRSGFETTLLEGAAQSLATLIEQTPITRSAHWADWLIAMFVGIVTVNFVLVVSPGKGVLFVFAECAGAFVMGWVLLRGFGIWFDLAHPLIIACVGYYLVIPYRLVDEYRKRWHYQEKSELMAQLEQLKSNFLSLVSHDLKTPIARIQGNAELVLGSDRPLEEHQKKSLNAIIKTTEDLGHYVESILDLTRIESARVPLAKSTRDINSTILEVMEEKRMLAHEKNIKFETHLDPIFSIRYDVKLMRRVIANILENAIQYSPPNSSITLKSCEDGNWVRVSVEDQGIGIHPEEREKVFAKFFRGQNEETQKVKGTGLGLYLVKYFIELHNGFIELDSDLGKGSTFTVALPVT